MVDREKQDRQTDQPIDQPILVCLLPMAGADVPSKRKAYLVGRPFARRLNVGLVRTDTETYDSDQENLVQVPQGGLLVLHDKQSSPQKQPPKLLIHFVNHTGVALFVRGSLQTYKNLSDATAGRLQRRDDTRLQTVGAGWNRLDLPEFLTEVPDAARLPKGETDVWKCLSVCVSTGTSKASHTQTKMFFWVFKVTNS